MKSALYREILSPTELYGALLNRQIRMTGAESNSLWVQSPDGLFLYACSGENCGKIHTVFYRDYYDFAGKVLTGQAASPIVLPSGESLYSVPIESEGRVFACTILTMLPGFCPEEEQLELAKVSSEAFSELLTEKELVMPRFLLSEGCLQLENITKIFGQGEATVRALDGINLSIRKGELLVILGSSGCGKSTLLNIIGGMSKPTSGRVIREGVDISDASEKMLTEYRRDKIGFVFQFYNLIPDLTAKENVSLSASLSHSGMTPDEALGYVGMDKKGDKYPSQLSGGEQQRVAIARAIVKGTDFLLCDEPTGALDLQTGKKVLCFIQSLVREQHKTVVIVTHNAAVAEIADRVIRLSDGKIVEEYVNTEISGIERVTW